MTAAPEPRPAVAGVSDNPFRRFAALGYTRLVPIVPPDAELSPTSSLAKRAGAGKDPRGKAVGVRGGNGLWFSYDWVSYECDDRDLDRWAAMGAGVGIKTGAMPDGTWLIGVDADTLDLQLAADVDQHLFLTLGCACPTRVGRAPKALYVVRVSGPLPYTRIDFGPETPPERVELLSEGRQFVAEGIHPGTRRPYEWVVPLVPYADLPVFAPEDLL